MMRIVSGKFKGHRIDAPEGKVTRPTTDRVRESMMSSIASLLGGFEGIAVCDAFAGSGALGIEALSRGAAQAVFCDKERAALRILKANLSILAIEPSSTSVLQRDVLRWGIPSSDTPYDLLLLDPPYRYDPAQVLGIVQKSIVQGVLSKDALITYEHDGACTEKELVSLIEEYGLEPISSKRYGKTYIDHMRIRCID